MKAAHPGVPDLYLGLGEIVDTVVVPVVPLTFSGERHVQGMVEVVVPRRVEPPPARRARPHDPGVVGRGLGNDQHRPAERVCSVAERARELLDVRQGGRFDDGVQGIQAEGIDVGVAEPEARVSMNRSSTCSLPAPSKLRASPHGVR